MFSIKTFRYPIGSGRVTFSNAKSYMKAVAAAFIEIKTVKFTKKVLHFESAMDCQQINNRTVLEQKLSRLLCSAKLLSGASWPLLGRRSLLLLPLAPRTLLLQVQWTLFTYLPWMLQALYTIANIQRHGLLQLLLPCLLGVATWCWPSPPSAYHEEHKGWRQHGQVKSCLHLFEYQS